MNGFKDITKEIEQPEKLKEGDSPRISEEKALQAAPDIYQDALKSFDLRGDVAEESTEKKENDRTKILEKGEDGRYYDKSRGYDSIEAWEKEQKTSAKRYDSVAEYCKKKADKEWARFKNAEKNGESDADKWKHYDRAREYYEKAGANKAKGEALWAKLKEFDESQYADERIQWDYQEEVPENQYTGTELLRDIHSLPSELIGKGRSKEELVEMQTLCDVIAYRVDKEEEVAAGGGVLPKYQRLMEEVGYMDEEEMCNAEGLNFHEIYDNESTTYGEEYRKGFIDCIDNNVSPLTTSEDECSSEAYYQGLVDAAELCDYLET
ncbi:hypothetical protein [Anaerotignum faecicola]